MTNFTSRNKLYFTLQLVLYITILLHITTSRANIGSLISHHNLFVMSLYKFTNKGFIKAKYSINTMQQR